MTNVLLVEDDRLNRLLIEDIFDHEFQGQAHLLVAETGEEAVELAERHQPRIILVDINLPGIDGLETTRRILRQPANRESIVWALTAHDSDEHRQAAFAAGCRGYITKPCDIRSLRQQLRTMIGEPHAKSV